MALAVVSWVCGPSAVQGQPPQQPGGGTWSQRSGQPDDGIEQMDGPDAWELLEMGPFGLLHRGTEGPPQGGPGMRLNAFEEHQRELEQQLGVTPAQHARIEAILERQQRLAVVQRRSFATTVRELEALLGSVQATRASIELKIDIVASIQSDLTKSRLRALLDSRSVLTAAQRAKLQTVGKAGRLRRSVPRP